MDTTSEQPEKCTNSEIIVLDLNEEERQYLIQLVILITFKVYNFFKLSLQAKVISFKI